MEIFVIALPRGERRDRLNVSGCQSPRVARPPRPLLPGWSRESSEVDAGPDKAPVSNPKPPPPRCYGEPSESGD